MTAALMNTHIRDNFLQTAPAKASAIGDVFFADAVNSLNRLAAGTTGQFLRGGTSNPTWNNTLLGDLTLGSLGEDAQLFIFRAIGHIAMHERGGTDEADQWIIEHDADLFKVRFVDDSLSTTTNSLQLAEGDFILHTGLNNTGEGAVVIATDTSSSTTALTTSGSLYLDATGVGTGGPAYVEGFWMVELERTSAASVSGVQIFPRNDGVNLSTHFNYGSANTGIADIIPAANDSHTFTGMFWNRVTSSDTSDYEIFITADDNSRFQVNRGHVFVRSIQYPT